MTNIFYFVENFIYEVKQLTLLGKQAFYYIAKNIHCKKSPGLIPFDIFNTPFRCFKKYVLSLLHFTRVTNMMAFGDIIGQSCSTGWTKSTLPPKYIFKTRTFWKPL